jgi:hypothetical protein
VSDEPGKPRLKESEAATVLGGAAVRIWGPGPAADTERTSNGTPQNNPAGEKPGRASRREIGGRDGPDPTRFGDWEIKGRCIDF